MLQMVGGVAELGSWRLSLVLTVTLGDRSSARSACAGRRVDSALVTYRLAEFGLPVASRLGVARMAA